MITNEELIEKAASVINKKKTEDTSMGGVGSALVTEKDNIYLGVCIDTISGMGFCAEHNAIGSMVTSKEYRIKKIVAVWKNEDEELYILAPCGRCREFMYQIDEENLETDVILDKNEVVKLKELLPRHDWFKKQG